MEAHSEYYCNRYQYLVRLFMVPFLVEWTDAENSYLFKVEHILDDLDSVVVLDLIKHKRKSVVSKVTRSKILIEKREK